MYLVPAEKYSEAPKKHSPPISMAPNTQSLSPPPQKKKKKKKTKKKKTKKQKRHPYEKWVKYRKKMREDEIRRMTQMHAITDFFQKVLPRQPVPPTTPPAIAKAPPPPPPTTRRLAFGTQTTPEKKNKLSPHHNPRLQRQKHSPLRPSQVSQKSVTTMMIMMMIMFSSRKMLRRSAERM